MKVLEFDGAWADEIEFARVALRKSEKHFSDDVLKRAGIKKGQVFRDPDTGATYRVESASAFVSGHAPHVTLQGTRIYWELYI